MVGSERLSMLAETLKKLLSKLFSLVLLYEEFKDLFRFNTPSFYSEKVIMIHTYVQYNPMSASACFEKIIDLDGFVANIFYDNRRNMLSYFNILFVYRYN